MLNDTLSVTILPLSVVSVRKASERRIGFEKYAGRIFRIGFYRKEDGHNRVWLVNDAGRYEEVLDQGTLRAHFKILQRSQEPDIYGEKKIIGPRSSDLIAGRVREHTYSSAPALRPEMEIQIVPPLTLVRLRSNYSGWEDIAGRDFRIGYYSKNDGLDCVWLVDDTGDYGQTTDQEQIRTDFEVMELSKETDLFGVNRPIILPRKVSS